MPAERTGVQERGLDGRAEGQGEHVKGFSTLLWSNRESALFSDLNFLTWNCRKSSEWMGSSNTSSITPHSDHDIIQLSNKIFWQLAPSRTDYQAIARPRTALCNVTRLASASPKITQQTSTLVFTVEQLFACLTFQPTEGSDWMN